MPAGRPKGAKNKRTVEMIEKAKACGYVDPVDFLLGVVADTEAGMDLRIDAAKAAAPYVRAKLTAVGKPAEQPLSPEEPASAYLPDLEVLN
jgi:hypothetical protein